MLKYNRGYWGKLNSLTAKNSTHKRIFLKIVYLYKSDSYNRY